MKKVNQLKAGALLSYISLGLGNVISIIYTPVMLRLLGQSEYGLYNLSDSMIGYLAILDFGLETSIVRYIAKYRAIKDEDGESNLRGLFLIMNFILAIIVVVSGIIIILNTSKLFSNTLSLEEISKMKILMGLMIFNLIISLPGSVFSSVIIAYERFVFLKILNIIRVILNPCITLPFLILGYKSISMTIIITVINSVYIVVNIYYCLRVLGIKIKFKSMDVSIIKEICLYSFFIFLDTVIDKVYWSADQFILGAVKGTSAVAVFAIGSKFNNYYMNFALAISDVFLPKVTKMVTNEATDKELSDLFIKVGRIQFIIISFVLGGFIIVGKKFIKLWAGEGYEDAYFISLIEMIPFTIPLIQSMGTNIMNAKNIQKFRVILCTIIAIFNIVISVPLGKALGGVGCALATAGAMIIGDIIIINIYYYKKINIDIISFWKSIIKMSIPLFISVTCTFLLKNIINIDGWISILIDGGIFTLMFIILMWFLSMNKYEKKLFIGPFSSHSNK